MQDDLNATKAYPEMNSPKQSEVQHAFEFTKVIVLSSLEPHERHTSATIRDHITNELMHLGMRTPVEYHEIESVVEFKARLNQILLEAKSGTIPLLHIDCHGDTDTGLIFENNSELSWKEFSSLLKPINIACGFNLLLCASCCYGGYFIREMDLVGSCPCWAVVATTEEVDPADIYSGFMKFYSALFRKKHFGRVEDMLRAATTQKWFTNTAEKWYLEICTWAAEEHLEPAMRSRINNLDRRLKSIGVQKTKKEIRKELNNRHEESVLTTYFRIYFCIDEIPSNEQRFHHIKALVLSDIKAKRKSGKYWI